MGELIWGDLVSPKFSVPHSGKTMRQTHKSSGGARTCSRSSITMPSLVELGFHPPPGWPKTLIFFVCLCLSVCPSCFWMSEIVCPISPWRHWSTETILMPLDRGRFVVVHPCSTFSDCCQLATPLNAEVQKTAKIGVFPTSSLPERDRINRPRLNLARKRTTRSAIAHQIWLLSVKGGWYRSPPKCQNLPKIVFFGH